MGNTVAKRPSKNHARSTAQQIRDAVVDVWRLLTEAHDESHWSVLEYDSFEAYAKAEFGMSSSNAWRLVTQGHVTAALDKASGGALPSGIISARLAGELAPDIVGVSEAIEQATEGKEDEERASAAREELENIQRLHREQRRENARRAKEKAERDSRARESEQAEKDSRARESGESAPPPTQAATPAPPPEEPALSLDEVLALLLTFPDDELKGSLEKITALKAKVDGAYTAAGGQIRVSAELAWQALKLFDTPRYVEKGYDELKLIQRRIAEALKFTPHPVGTVRNPKRSEASTNGPQVTTHFKGGK